MTGLWMRYDRSDIIAEEKRFVIRSVEKKEKLMLRVGLCDSAKIFVCKLPNTLQFSLEQ